MSTSDESSSEPSQIMGQLNQLKGTAYQAVGTVTGSAEWTESSVKSREDGKGEVEEARSIAQGEATRDRWYGKGQSALGMLTGDQDKQSEGNVRAEQAEWKGAVARGELPSVSGERMKGKLESAVGMATGNQDKQNEGNVRAEKAEWMKG